MLYTVSLSNVQIAVKQSYIILSKFLGWNSIFGLLGFPKSAQNVTKRSNNEKVILEEMLIITEGGITEF